MWQKIKCWLGHHRWQTTKTSVGGQPIIQRCSYCPYRRDWGGIWFSGWEKPYKD